MKAIPLILTCVLLLSNCQNKPSQNAENATENTATSSSEGSEIGEAAAPTAPQAEVLKRLGHHSWYEGKLDDLDIWFYIEGGSVGHYGYKGQKGSIWLNIKQEGSTLLAKHASTQKGKEYTENFELSYQAETGALKGSWENGKKQGKVLLSPLNTKINNTKELLQNSAELVLPIHIDYGPESNLGINLIPYFDKKSFNRFVPNLGKLVGDVKSSPDGDVLETEPDGIVIGHVKNGNGYWLFFSLSLADNMPFDMESGTDVLAVAYVDEAGKVLDAIFLGNDGDDSYFLDFMLDIAQPQRFSTSRLSFMRDMGARVFEEGTKQTYEIKNNKIAMVKSDKITE